MVESLNFATVVAVRGAQIAVVGSGGQWGPSSRYIPADLNEDCEVGFNDPLVVLGGWGSCA